MFGSFITRSMFQTTLKFAEKQDLKHSYKVHHQVRTAERERRAAASRRQARFCKTAHPWVVRRMNKPVTAYILVYIHTSLALYLRGAPLVGLEVVARLGCKSGDGDGDRTSDIWAVADCANILWISIFFFFDEAGLRAPVWGSRPAHTRACVYLARASDVAVVVAPPPLIPSSSSSSTLTYNGARSLCSEIKTCQSFFLFSLDRRRGEIPCLNRSMLNPILVFSCILCTRRQLCQIARSSQYQLELSTYDIIWGSMVSSLNLIG